MSPNKLLYLAQAMTAAAGGAIVCFAVCVGVTELQASLTATIMAVAVVAIFACTCLVATMLNANRKLQEEILEKVDRVISDMGEREKFAEAAAARALVAHGRNGNGPDAEVFRLRHS